MRLYNKRGAQSAARYLPPVALVVVILFAFLYFTYPDRLEDVAVSTISSVIASLFFAITFIFVFGNRKYG